MESGDDARAAVEVLSVNSIPTEMGFAFGESDIDSVLDSTTSSSSNAIPVQTEIKKVRVPSKKEEDMPEMSYELQQAYKILRDIMSDSHKATNQPFLYAIDRNSISDPADYYEVIQKPMWLTKIKENLFSLRYTNITEFVADMRLVLENCYRYFGPDSPVTKKGIKLEVMMEQKLALLPREFREKTTLEATSGKSMEEWGGPRRKSNRFGASETSLILNHVRHEKSLRDKELRRRQMEERKAEKEEKEKGIVEWEDGLLQEPLRTQLKTAWELPQIGLFLYLCQGPLNTPEAPQYELERILMMPRESTLLSKIMTSLLSSPRIRAQLDRKMSMPYKVWTEKLATKVEAWYRIFAAKENNTQAVFDHIGVEPTFFEILGSTNPLEETPFHELTFQQRLWLLKSLCDYVMHNHKTIQESINEQAISDQRDYFLGEDLLGNRYLHFPQFCGQDLRIYRQGKWKAPALDIPESFVAAAQKAKRFKRQKKKEKTTGRKLREEPNRPKKVVPPPIQHSRPSHLRQTIKPVIKPVEVKVDSSATDEASEEEETESEEEPEVPSDNEEVCGEEKPSFELIVDSVEALRQLIKQMAEDMAKRRKMSRKGPKSLSERECASLHEHLSNLLAELEPWEVKLQQATTRLRKKLHKEWHDHQMKRGRHEEETEDIWSSDEEETTKDENNQDDGADDDLKEQSSSSETSTSSDEEPPPAVSTRVATTAARKRRAELVNSSNATTDDEDEPSERQRKALTHTFRANEVIRTAAKRKRTEDIRLPNGATKGLLISHSQQNTASQARELYAWETLRQILVSPQKKRSPSPPTEILEGCGNAVNQPTTNAYQTTIRNLLSGPQQSAGMKEASNSSQELQFVDDYRVPVCRSSSSNVGVAPGDSSPWLESNNQETTKSGASYYNYIPTSVLSSALAKTSQPCSSNSTVSTTPTVTTKKNGPLQVGVAARRQTNLSIGIPTHDLALAGSLARLSQPLTSGSASSNLPGNVVFSPTPNSATLPQTPKSAISSEAVLTPAANSGTPKFLANVAGANAQFMHLKLGSPTTKKNVRVTSVPSTPTEAVLPLSANPKVPLGATVSKQTQQQTVLLIPAVDDKGNTVYFKVVSSTPAASATTSTPLLQTRPFGQFQHSGISPAPATSALGSLQNFGVSPFLSQVSPTLLTTENKLTSATVQGKKVPLETSVGVARPQMPLRLVQETAVSSGGKISGPSCAATTSTVASLSTLCSIFPPKSAEAFMVSATKSDNVVAANEPAAQAARQPVAKPKGSFMILSQPPPLGPICSTPKLVATANRDIQKRPKLSFQVLTQPPPLAQIGSGAKTTPTTVLTIPQPTSSIQAPLIKTTASPNIPNSLVSLQRPTFIGQVIPSASALPVANAVPQMAPAGQLVLKQPVAKNVGLLMNTKCDTSASSERVPASHIVLASVPASQIKRGKPAAILQSPTKSNIIVNKVLQSVSNPGPVSATRLPQQVVLSQPVLTNHVQPAAQQVCTILPQNLSAGQTILISPPTITAQKKVVGSPVLQPLVHSVNSPNIISSSHKLATVSKDQRTVMTQQLNVPNTAPSPVVSTNASSSGSTLLLNLPTGSSPSRLVMIQNGQTQSLGLLTENGQIVPINITANPSGTQILPIANKAAVSPNQPTQSRANSFVSGNNVTVVLNSDSTSNLNTCGTSQRLSGILPTNKPNFAVVSSQTQPAIIQLSGENQNLALNIATDSSRVIVTTSIGASKTS